MSLGIKSTENLKGLQDIKRIHEISEYFNLSGKVKYRCNDKQFVKYIVKNILR